MRHSSSYKSNSTLHSRIVVLIILATIALPQAHSLQVVTGSNCTSKCLSSLNKDSTNGSDIACHDNDYNTTVTGGTFQECVACELQSQSIDHQTNQTDLGWAFYNMRYALDWCVFDYPESRNQSVSNTCSATCAPVSNALETNLLIPNASTPYDFCQNSEFLGNVGACASCYQIIPNQLYLSNFLNTLQYACQNQQLPGTPFYIKPNDIFTHDPPSNWSNIADPVGSSHGLPHSAKVALAISIPVCAFLILSLLFVWLFVRRQSNQPPPKRHSYYNEKHISKSSTNWNGQPLKPPRNAFQQSRHISGRESPRPVPYPAPLSPQKVPIPAPLRQHASHTSIPFDQVFGSPMGDGPVPGPLRPTRSNQSIPYLQPTKYSPPPTSDPKKKTFSLSTRAQRPHAPPSGLVSWERIAIQNARIRATQGQSPSPVSPLTKVQVVPLPRATGHRPSIPFRHDSPFRRESPFRHDTPFRQDSLIPLHRQDSQVPSLLRRPSSSTLGMTHLADPESRPPRRHPSKKGSRHSTIPEPEPPRRQGTPGQGEALKEDAPPVPSRHQTLTSSPMMPLSPIRPLSPILRPTNGLSDIPCLRSEASTMQQHPDLMRPETLRPDTFRANYMRSDTPNPDDGILGRRSGAGGVMRSGSGKSRGSRKEVRWSKDVDYD